jgi:undecaprenyl-diphosphatase
LETILQFDETVFFWINHNMTHPWLDAIVPFWREKSTWIPLYIGLIVYALYRLGWKNGLIWVILLAATVGLADQISSKAIKKNVQRLRPCNNTEIYATVRLRTECGSGYSFTSSHATNHFAIASFVVATLVSLWWVKSLWWFWAATIAVGQVYVGVHYPIDILVGGLLGALLGWIASRFWRSRIVPYLKGKTQV